MQKTNQQRKSVLVRMSPRLWDALSKWAQAEFRSINGQIEFLLHKAVQDHRRGLKDEAPPVEQHRPNRGDG